LREQRDLHHSKMSCLTSTPRRLMPRTHPSPPLRHLRAATLSTP
jgi:hypothetical protein